MEETDSLTESLCSAAWKGDLETVQNLIPKMKITQINAVNERGQCALYCAARNGHTKIVEEFLSVAGINVNVQENHGSTALHAASYQPYPNILSLLLTFGCDLTIKNSQTGNPTARAEARMEAIKVWKAFEEQGVTGLLEKKYQVYPASIQIEHNYLYIMVVEFCKLQIKEDASNQKKKSDKSSKGDMFTELLTIVNSRNLSLPDIFKIKTTLESWHKKESKTSFFKEKSDDNIPELINEHKNRESKPQSISDQTLKEYFQRNEAALEFTRSIFKGTTQGTIHRTLQKEIFKTTLKHALDKFNKSQEEQKNPIVINDTYLNALINLINGGKDQIDVKDFANTMNLNCTLNDFANNTAELIQHGSFMSITNHGWSRETCNKMYLGLREHHWFLRRSNIAHANLYVVYQKKGEVVNERIYSTKDGYLFRDTLHSSLTNLLKDCNFRKENEVSKEFVEWWLQFQDFVGKGIKLKNVLEHFKKFPSGGYLLVDDDEIFHLVVQKADGKAANIEIKKTPTGFTYDTKTVEELNKAQNTGHNTLHDAFESISNNIKIKLKLVSLDELIAVSKTIKKCIMSVNILQADRSDIDTKISDQPTKLHRATVPSNASLPQTTPDKAGRAISVANTQKNG